MAEQQKIHPVDLEAPPPSAPLVPRNYSRSDKGDPAAAVPYPPFRRTIPVEHARPPKRRRNCCYRCFCWTLFTIILLVVIVAATIGILYLIFDPKIPKYSVDRLTVANFSVDTNLTATAAFDVTVTAKNPNKKIGIYYVGGSDLSVWYDDTSLCNGIFPEFYQGHQNTTIMVVVLTGETQIGSEIVTALQKQEQTGSVPLRFNGDVPVKVKLGALKLWKMTFGMRCDLVVNSLTSSNQISIKTSNCKLKKVKIF